MLEGELFDTNNPVSQTKGNADMGEPQNPKMDVSNYSNILSDDNETSNTLEIDSNTTISDNIIPEQTEEQNNSIDQTSSTEVNALEDSKSLNLNPESNNLNSINQNNSFPISTLEQAPNNEIPEQTTDNNQKAVQEMVTDNTELSQLKLIQKNSEKLTGIEKTILEKRISDLEQSNNADNRSFETGIKKNRAVSLISSKDELIKPIGLNTDDLATFLNSTKNPPIWRVL
jgi:hypothetical protein